MPPKAAKSGGGDKKESKGGGDSKESGGGKTSKKSHGDTGGLLGRGPGVADLKVTHSYRMAEPVGSAKTRFDLISTNQKTAALRETIGREDRVRGDWERRWRHEVMPGTTGPMISTSSIDGSWTGGTGVTGSPGANTRLWGWPQAPISTSRDLAAGSIPSHTMPPPPLPSQTIERKVTRQIAVPVVRRVRVPIARFGAPPHQPEGYRVDELQSRKIMELEEVQTFMMTPEPMGQPRLVASREIGSVDDTRRLGTQVFPIGDERVRDLEDDHSVRGPVLGAAPTYAYVPRPGSGGGSRGRAPSPSARSVSSSGLSISAPGSSARPGTPGTTPQRPSSAGSAMAATQRRASLPGEPIPRGPGGPPGVTYRPPSPVRRGWR